MSPCDGCYYSAQSFIDGLTVPCCYHPGVVGPIENGDPRIPVETARVTCLEKGDMFATIASRGRAPK